MAYLAQRLLLIMEMTAHVAGELALLFASLILQPQRNEIFQK